jgi:ribosomal protein S18 acetylase RimI-like enzyme
MVNVDLRVRPAVFADQRQIASLIQFESRLHRHLDWRNPLDWIGSPPYLVLESFGRVAAALGCPPDPPPVAWIRLFVCSGALPLEEAWSALWEGARAELAARGHASAAIILMQDWLRGPLQKSGFQSHQQVVMLARELQELPSRVVPDGIAIRPLMHYDLPAVAGLDAAAFGPFWYNSPASLERAFPQAAWATVAESAQGILGYQISTQNPLGGHLARLAVRADTQGRGVGAALVADLLHRMNARGLNRLTVNTQNDNAASLSLYRKFGFRETGDRYPVFVYQT